MACKLLLKKRPSRDGLTLPISAIPADDEALVALVRRLAQAPTVHDKRILDQVVQWTPEGGLPLAEAARWFKLARRVADLDEEKEGEFTLSDFQADLVWHRLTDPRFKVQGLSPPFVSFVMDLKGALGKKFPDEDPSE